MFLLIWTMLDDMLDTMLFTQRFWLFCMYQLVLIVQGRDCIFPFTYLGVKYKGCAPLYGYQHQHQYHSQMCGTITTTITMDCTTTTITIKSSWNQVIMIFQGFDKCLQPSLLVQHQS